MKSVIFIGGTSYSGSTLFDLFLSNSPDAFSCGEVHALFHPYRKHHINPECGCGDENCHLWTKVHARGAKNLYQSIFNEFPNINTIIDSSKDPLWINDRMKELQKSKIQTKNILIWKSPEEFYSSCKKRNKENNWQTAWMNYHRLYFRMIKNWQAVQYSNFAQFSETRAGVCEYLDLPFEESKNQFWNKQHHTLFGNTSAKIHLYEQSSTAYKQCQAELNEKIATPDTEISEENNFQKIYYSKPSDDDVNDHNITNKQKIAVIQSILNKKDVSQQNRQNTDIILNQYAIDQLKSSQTYFMQNRIKNLVRRLKVLPQYLLTMSPLNSNESTSRQAS